MCHPYCVDMPFRTVYRADSNVLGGANMPIKQLDDVLHRIRVKLYRSNLPRAKGGFYARPANEAALSVEDVAAALKNRGGFTGNYHDLVRHVREFFWEMAYQLCDGFAVNTGWFVVQPVIKGFFETAVGDFDIKKHAVGFRYRTGVSLRKLARNVVIEIEGEADVSGMIECITDVVSGAANQTVTPGGFFNIDGRRIKVIGPGGAAEPGPDCGVWFLKDAGGAPAQSPHRYKVTRALSVNTCSHVIGMVPALPAGEYGVEIVTCYAAGGNQLKSPKTIKSGFTVRVS